MAIQNFCCTARNINRETDKVCSGKEVDAEFMVKKKGKPTRVVDICGRDNEDGTVTTWVEVFDPNTGEKIYDGWFDTEK